MNNRVGGNVKANGLQAIAASVLLFVLYRFIITTLGVEELGVWSVVLAAVSASRLADFGLSAGVTRFVARDLARGLAARAVNVVDTALLVLSALVGIALFLLYPLLAMVLGYLFEGKYLVDALEILPYALLSLWLSVCAAVFQGGLDGCQRMELRAWLVVSGQLLLLLIAVFLVPRCGLLGLAWAQIGQGVFLLIAGRFLLRQALQELPWIPRSCSGRVLKEMLGYGINMQSAAIFMFLFDALTKMFMVRFGGPASAGYFEMANQVVIKSRSVIVTANQAVVPYVATLMETAPDKISSFYRENVRLLFFFTFPIFSLIIAYAENISWLLLDENSQEFMLLTLILSVAWAGNTLTVPAYFTNMGSGHVGWNTLSHGLIGIVNLAFGILLGSHYGTYGVAAAYAAALLAGSGMLIFFFNANNRPKRGIGVFRENRALMAACLCAVGLSWFGPAASFGDSPVLAFVLLFFPLLIVGLSAWRHPLRRHIQDSLLLRAAEDRSAS